MAGGNSCKPGETPGFPRFWPASRWKQLTFPHGDWALRFVSGRVVVRGVGPVRLARAKEREANARLAALHKAAHRIVGSADVIASAMLDRFLHHCHVLNLKGESYRMKSRNRGTTQA